VSEIEIVNPVRLEDVRPWVASATTTFLGDSAGDDMDRMVEAWRRDWPGDRVWGARAHGRWVATLATEPRSISIPGPAAGTVDLVADCVTAVTVSATHRRRGLMTEMLLPAMRTAKDRGEPFSVLIAAEWPIYGRFGYSPATESANYVLFGRTRPDLLAPTGSGSIRQVEPSELGEIAPAVFAAARRLRVGQIDRRNDWWKRRLGLDGYQRAKTGNAPTFIMHEGAGGPDGLLWWSSTREFEPTGDLGAISVGDLSAATPTAYRNLWAYLAGMDVVGEVHLEHRPVDEPIRWLLSDGRALRQTHAADDLWLRLLDVPAALAARGYAASGRLALEVVDDDTGGYAAGRYLLDAGEAGADCRPTTTSADLRISQRALASIYLGGFTVRQVLTGGGIEELTSGALLRADAMFATTLPPWNATNF
jgi:predicted acetyltransferase